MKKVYWENVLPTKQRGNKTIINWKESIGKTVKFIYENTNGSLKIEDYKNEYLYVKYLNYNIFKIDINSFKNGKIGRLIRQITSDFKVEIGQVFKDNKRYITITNREYRKDNNSREWKVYKYKCNKCGNEDWIKENHLLQGENCNVCCSPPKKIVLGINTIWDTDRWMCDLGVSEEDAKTHTHSSNDKITVTCPDCGRTKKVTINNIYTYKSISCVCSDKISYPEKFVLNMLEQLQLNFITQLSKTTFKWCDNYRYDFYFKYNNKQYIIETHGKQHYNGGFNSYGGRTLEEERSNDRYKKELALKNGIEDKNYIVIDCSKSDLEFIKQNIINSKLNELFDLSIIDWDKVEEFALNNLVKQVCNYWNLHNKEYISTTMVGEIFNINLNTVITFLKKGTRLKWCYYNPKESKINSCKRLNRTINKVEIFEDGKSLGIFINCAELQRQSKKMFNVELIWKGISSVCRGERKTYKGYTFKYV